MEVADSAGIELPAQFPGNRRGDQLPRLRKLVQPLEEPVHPFGDRGAALAVKAASGCDIADRQDAWHDLDARPDLGHLVAESKKAIGREEELGDRPIGTSIDL